VAELLQHSLALMSDQINMHDAPRMAANRVIAMRRVSGVENQAGKKEKE
jgi:aspartokinase-like uncharacterized kinase